MQTRIRKAVEFIEAYVPGAMHENHIPGLSVSITNEEEVVYSDGFGYRDIGGFLRITPDTMSGIGSCTKPFVALGIMQLHEEGKLRLDDKISKYVPCRLGSKNNPITIHHLLCHTSGIPDLQTTQILLSRLFEAPVLYPMSGEKDFYRYVNSFEKELCNKPGDRFFYSNEGYRMLAHVIQNVSGTTFHEYITENVLQPLGMERTTFVKRDFDGDENKVTPYIKEGKGKPKPVAMPYPDVGENPGFSFVAGAGGMYSTTNDLCRYLRAMMNGGTYSGERIISRNSIRKMCATHIRTGHPVYKNYGYGWQIVDDFQGYSIIGHGGSVFVSAAAISCIPELKLGVAILTNCSDFPYAGMDEGIYASLLGKNPYVAVKEFAVQKKLKKFTGSYSVASKLARMHARKAGSNLFLELVSSFPSSKSSFMVIPDEDFLKNNALYQYSGANRAKVQFIEKKNGKIDLYYDRMIFHKE